VKLKYVEGWNDAQPRTRDALQRTLLPAAGIASKRRATAERCAIQLPQPRRRLTMFLHQYARPRLPAATNCASSSPHAKIGRQHLLSHPAHLQPCFVYLATAKATSPKPSVLPKKCWLCLYSPELTEERTRWVVKSIAGLLLLSCEPQSNPPTFPHRFGRFPFCSPGASTRRTIASSSCICVR